LIVTPGRNQFKRLWGCCGTNSADFPLRSVASEAGAMVQR